MRNNTLLQKKIKQAIAQNPYQKEFQKVFLFGSVAKNKATAKSDVDLLIKFCPNSKIGLFELVDIEDAFEKSLNKEVDLVLEDALTNRYFKKDVLKNRQLVYEKE